ncbi:MAG TPA: c-type cytochrome [Thermoanaerobaculia bacterium]|nr:c-type cytochrome [Thermoanaerobaculia bacterium]
MRGSQAALAVFCAALGVAGCGGGAEEEARRLTGGEPERGRELLRSYGCGTCHTVPGVSGAGGLVGPPLERLGSRGELAGSLPNNPDNLILWIRHPQRVAPGTAMPDMGIGERDARDMAAYLYTLR